MDQVDKIIKEINPLFKKAFVQHYKSSSKYVEKINLSLKVVETEVIKRLQKLGNPKLNSITNAILCEIYGSLEKFATQKRKLMNMLRMKLPPLEEEQFSGLSLVNMGIPSRCGDIDRIGFLKKYILKKVAKSAHREWESYAPPKKRVKFSLDVTFKGKKQ